MAQAHFSLCPTSPPRGGGCGILRWVNSHGMMAEQRRDVPRVAVPVGSVMVTVTPTSWFTAQRISVSVLSSAEARWPPFTNQRIVNGCTVPISDTEQSTEARSASQKSEVICGCALAGDAIAM